MLCTFNNFIGNANMKIAFIVKSNVDFDLFCCEKIVLANAWVAYQENRAV